MKLLFTADGIGFEPDGVVSHLVEEQREADWGSRVGRLDPADDAAVGIAHLPGAAAHLAAPAADADGVLGFDPPENRLEVAHCWDDIGGDSAAA